MKFSKEKKAKTYLNSVTHLTNFVSFSRNRNSYSLEFSHAVLPKFGYLGYLIQKHSRVIVIPTLYLIKFKIKTLGVLSQKFLLSETLP